jgi:serine/threonine protein kinase
MDTKKWHKPYHWSRTISRSFDYKEASFYVDLSRHPHIVRTFGLVRDDDGDRNSIMLLQECASEGSLYELLCERKKPLDEKILLQIFLQIIDAMSYLALNNVVHGDLACRNVLVFRFDEKNSRNIVVKVTDFGLSRYIKHCSRTIQCTRNTFRECNSK